jgi:hypothetical protein
MYELFIISTKKHEIFKKWWYRIFYVQFFHDLKTSFHTKSKIKALRNLIFQKILTGISII